MLCASVRVCLHMHVLLYIRRVVIAPVRTNSSCEELVSMEGSVLPAARVWSHSGLAKYTAAGSLISAADISKQHKNVGAVPSSFFLPLHGTGLAWLTSLHAQRPGTSAALGPRGNTLVCAYMCIHVAFWDTCVGRCGLWLLVWLNSDTPL